MKIGLEEYLRVLRRLRMCGLDSRQEISSGILVDCGGLPEDHTENFRAGTV